MKESKQAHYFEHVDSVDDVGKGTREMSPLAPFVVSGGKNTERYYFIHVSALSDKYKFNIRPEYFENESAYTKIFPKKITEILSKNADAKIFCVFDMDTVVKGRLHNKHKDFEDSLQSKIESGQVVLCESMPSFEFWLLLHFIDYQDLLNDYRDVSNVLAPYIRSYFAGQNIRLKKLLKKEKHLQNPVWVQKLLDEGRLEKAVKRAKVCLAREMREKGKHSYTKVYKAFE